MPQNPFGDPGSGYTKRPYMTCRAFLHINNLTKEYKIYITMKSENYISPSVEVTEAMTAGILCTSGYADDSYDVELF